MSYSYDVMLAELVTSQVTRHNFEAIQSMKQNNLLRFSSKFLSVTIKEFSFRIRELEACFSLENQTNEVASLHFSQDDKTTPSHAAKPQC